MNRKKILLTGGSGKLGQAIQKRFKQKIIAPSSEVLDISNHTLVRKFFEKNDFDVIIHCAALARMAKCQNNPLDAIETNIIGTCNLAIETLRKQSREGKTIRFVYISTDGVYNGTKGNYSEKDETIPYNIYGFSKLGGECAVNALPDFCVIRTSFFDPKNIKFDHSATDAYSSKMPINELAKAILVILQKDFVGTVNIGSKRESEFDRYKAYKPGLKESKLSKILKEVPFGMAKDASMNTQLWKALAKK